MTMDVERWRRLLDLFADARELDPEARERLLVEVAREDPSLAAEVRSLLVADARPGIMDAMAAHVDRVPERIGAYRVLHEIGRGGMGVVYLAERADGQFEQRVAIKLIASTSADDPLHQRFLAERRILAGLVHPHIARLFDGGILDDGRPYLVMEYVDGLPITDWCDRRGLDLRARLRLFADVCTAVQHAHRNLVIHRDLKPTNILVSDDGRVHLLDFGIAKLMAPEGAAGGEPATRHELRAMTPEYASPEQVRGDPLTTASDIYSLGVLLYLLLCGRPPYRLTRGSLLEMAKVVCEQDPERPSVRAARGDAVAEPRGTTAPRLARELEGDLDGIVMMAMRKEPERRYATADQLRQDVERHLHGRAVRAHRGGRRYRLGKFLRRHRVETAAVALMAGGLVTGLSLAVAESRRATRERDRAEVARAQSEGVTEFMLELFRSGDAEDTVTVADLSAVDLLERGAARADALAAQPAVQARLLDVLGRMSLHLGRYDEAQRHLEEAVRIRRAALDDAPTELATSLIHLARVLRARVQQDSARVLVSEALALRERHLPARDPDIAEAMYELGWLTGGPAQERWYRGALDILPDTGARAERRVVILQALSTSLRRQGRLDEAVAADREALRVAESVFGPEHQATGQAMVHLADHVRDIEADTAAAEQLYRGGLARMTRRYGENSVRLLHGLHSLGNMLSARGDPEAEAVLRRAIAIRRTASGPEHPAVAEGMQYLAQELARRGRVREAESMQRQALAHSIRTLGEQHPVVMNLRVPGLALILERMGRRAEVDSLYELAIGRRNAPYAIRGELARDHGRILLRRGDLERAERELLRALDLLVQHYQGQDHPNIRESKRALMELYEQWGKPELVERYRVPPGRYVAY